MATKRSRTPNKTNAARQCLLVLGMHRSGTSVITQILSIAGAKLPADLLGLLEVVDVCKALTSVWVAVLQAALDAVIRARSGADGPLARVYLIAHAARYPLDLETDLEQPLLGVLDGWHNGFAAVAEHQGKLCLTSFADAE